MLIVDMHAQAGWAGQMAPSERDYATPEEVLQRYDELGIASGVLLPRPANIRCDAAAGSEDVLAMARHWPERFLPFCAVDPKVWEDAPERVLVRQLTDYKAQGCRGIAVSTVGLSLDHSLLGLLLEHCASLELPVMTPIAAEPTDPGLYDTAGLPGLEAVLKTLPNLTMLAYGTVFWSEIAVMTDPASERQGYCQAPISQAGRLPELLRRCRNLHGILSGHSGYNALSRDVDFAVAFINRFQRQLFFGSGITHLDTPVPLLGFLEMLVREGLLKQRCFARIVQDNATRLLNIKM